MSRATEDLVVWREPRSSDDKRQKAAPIVSTAGKDRDGHASIRAAVWVRRVDVCGKGNRSVARHLWRAEFDGVKSSLWIPLTERAEESHLSGFLRVGPCECALDDFYEFIDRHVTPELVGDC